MVKSLFPVRAEADLGVAPVGLDVQPESGEFDDGVGRPGPLSADRHRAVLETGRDDMEPRGLEDLRRPVRRQRRRHVDVPGVAPACPQQGVAHHAADETRLATGATDGLDDFTGEAVLQQVLEIRARRGPGVFLGCH